MARRWKQSSQLEAKAQVCSLHVSPIARSHSGCSPNSISSANLARSQLANSYQGGCQREQDSGLAGRDSGGQLAV